MKNFPYPKKKYWNNVKYKVILDGYSNLKEEFNIEYLDSDFMFLPRLETDIEDDWIGVEPKRFKKNKSLIENWSKILKSMLISERLYNTLTVKSLYPDLEDRNKVNWNKFFKNNDEFIISPLFNYKKISYDTSNVNEIFDLLLTNIDYVKYLNEILEENQVITVDWIFKNLKDCNYEKYSKFFEPSFLWKKKFNYIPKDAIIKDTINPFIFDSKTWNTSLTLLKKNGFNLNDQKVKKHICLLYNMFNGKITQLFNQIKNVDIILSINIVNFTVKEYDFLKLYNTHNNIKDIILLLTLINNHNINIKISSYIKAKNEVLNHLFSKKELKSNFVDKVYPYLNVGNDIENVNYVVSVLEKYQNFFLEYKNNKSFLPNLKGSLKSENNTTYDWEISKKDNPLNVILGDATNCCQTIGGAGVECLKYGLSKENSTFFIVKRNGKIVAQSWIWVNHDEKSICFDSIEILGRDIYSENVMKCYLEVSKELELKYKNYSILAGGDGNTIPNNINVYGILEDFNLFDLPSDYHEYSDAKEYQYIYIDKR